MTTSDLPKRGPNETLRDLRRGRRSPSRPTECLGRPELADMVNRELAAMGINHQDVDGNYIGKLEKGIIGAPREEVRREAFRRALQVPRDDDLGFFAYRRTSAYSPLLQGSQKSALPAEYHESTPSGQPTKSRDSYGRTLDSDSVLPAVEDRIQTSGLSSEIIDDWDFVIAKRGRETRYRGARELAEDLISDADGLEALLRRRQTSSSQRRITSLIARNSGLISLTMLKLRALPQSMRWSRVARISAADAGDRATLSWVWAQEAYAAFYAEDVAGAIEAADHACGVAGKRGGVGAALASALQARARAVAQDVNGARRAIGKAEELLMHLTTKESTRSAFGYDEPQLRFHAGNTYTHLRDFESAWESQRRALELYPSGDFLDRALVDLDRADCLAQQGDFTECARSITNTFGTLDIRQTDELLIARARGIVQPRLSGNPPAELSEVRDLLVSKAEERALLDDHSSASNKRRRVGGGGHC